MEHVIIKAENKVTGEVISKGNIRMPIQKADQLIDKWREANPENKFYKVPAR